MKALLLAEKRQLDRVYGPEQRERLSQLVDLEIYSGAYNDERAVRAALADKELVFSTWSMKTVDEAFLAAAPKMKAVFYAAGSVRRLATEAMWRRGIVLVSAWAANAVPVSEMSFSLIILSLKRYFAQAARYTGPDAKVKIPVAGAYRSTVGLIGMGMIGRKVRGLLANTDVRVLVYDPYLPASEARALDVSPVSLEAIFAESDVVSLHAPNIPETRHMLRAQHFRAMKEGATFINTARGALVDEEGLIGVLTGRPDLTALLDVTFPEPPVEGSPLYSLPNVILTPHIAGSMDQECYRMADYVMDECERFLAGQPLLYQITEERLRHMA